jgi:hypothetical protein
MAMAEEDMSIMNESPIAEVDNMTAEEAPATETVESSAAPTTEAAPETTPAAEGQPPTDIEKALQALLEEESGTKAKAPSDDLKLPADVDPKSKAANRWQQLANRTAQAETARTELETKLGQAGQYVERVQASAQQAIAQANARVEAMQAQLTALTQQMAGFKQPAAESQDPVERLQQSWMEKAKNVFGDELKKRDAEIATLKNQFTEREKAARLEADSQRYMNEANTAVRNVMFRGLPEELVAEMGDIAAGQVLSLATMQNIPIAQAAQITRQTYLKFGLGIIRGMSQQQRAALTKAKNGVPTPPVRGRAMTGKGEPLPSDEQLDKLGVDALTYMMRNAGG